MPALTLLQSKADYVPAIPRPAALSSHFPRSSRTRNSTPRTHSSTHMASHTPTSPIRGARRLAAVMRTPHMLTRFRMLGTRVSPAPRRAPATTMEAANSGSGLCTLSAYYE